jgi:hypothetical protein
VSGELLCIPLHKLIGQPVGQPLDLLAQLAQIRCDALV